MESQNQNYWNTDANQETEPAPAPVVSTPQEAAPSLQAQDPALMQAISWEASEFVHREKNSNWFIGTVAVGVVLSVFALFVLKEILFTIVIVVMTATVIFLAVRPPRVLRYQLTTSGLQINENHYDYHDFKAFGVVIDEGIPYITLLPIKRFMPAIDLYFPEEHGEAIVDLLGGYIPMQTIKPDIIDKLGHYLRF